MGLSQFGAEAFKGVGSSGSAVWRSDIAVYKYRLSSICIMYVCMYVCFSLSLCIDICIYIYGERDRFLQILKNIDMCICIYTDMYV